jgi:NAD(P)H-dependent nitrite reductase small subunit
MNRRETDMSNLAEKLDREVLAVCAVDDLETNLGVGALVKGRQIAIFKLRSGEVLAVGNHDPFSGANVLSRGLVGDLKGHKVVASPLYKQHFDLYTGECLEDPAVRIPVYEVIVDAGKVMVAV